MRIVMEAYVVFRVMLSCLIVCFHFHSIVAIAESQHSDSVVDNDSHSSNMAHPPTNDTRDSEHDDGEDEHHEEEGHHSGHAIVWPSAAGMMLFISGGGLIFYQVYTRNQMRKTVADESDHKTFFQQAVVSSTVAGIAAPGMLGFDERTSSSKKQSRSRRTRKFSSRTEVPQTGKFDSVETIREGSIGTIEVAPNNVAKKSPPHYHSLHK